MYSYLWGDYNNNRIFDTSNHNSRHDKHNKNIESDESNVETISTNREPDSAREAIDNNAHGQIDKIRYHDSELVRNKVNGKIQKSSKNEDNEVNKFLQEYNNDDNNDNGGSINFIGNSNNWIDYNISDKENEISRFKWEYNGNENRVLSNINGKNTCKNDFDKINEITKINNNYDDIISNDHYDRIKNNKNDNHVEPDDKRQNMENNEEANNPAGKTCEYDDNYGLSDYFDGNNNYDHEGVDNEDQ